MTKITLLCTDSSHPIYTYLDVWKDKNGGKYKINLLNKVNEIVNGGDILFLISCSEIVRPETKLLFKHVLVLHASDLPQGRGWSPHVWDILSGKDKIILSLLEAEEPVDTGDVWKKHSIPLDGNELFDEINDLLFKAELALIEWACENYSNYIAFKQDTVNSLSHRKRTPEDSQLDIEKSIDSQFDLLRVCDPNRFPAYFYKNGQKYIVRIEKNEK